MVVVADASVAIRGDLSGFHRDLKGAEKPVATLGGKIREIFSPRNVLAGAGALGVGLGVQQIISTVQDVIGEYSQLQQAQKTVDDVFGESADKIHEWAATAATSAGQSKREVETAAAVMGTTLRNMGYDAEEAADKTLLLIERASDLATAFPAAGGPERALLGITAAMRGERDTIEKYGVAIKQVDVNSRVAALGLDTSTAAAKKNAEAIAVLDLVFEQTEDSVGRFNEAMEEGDPRAVGESLGARIENANAGLVKNIEQTVNEVSALGDDVGDFFDNLFSPEKQAQVQAMADGLGITFTEMRDIIDREANAAGVEWEDQLAFMVMASEQSSEDMLTSGAKNARGFKEGLESERPNVVLAAEDIAEIPVDEIERRLEAINQAGADTVMEYAKGLLIPQTEVETAIQTALQIIETEMGVVEEMAYLSGQMTTLEHARGIASAEGKEASVLAIDAALAEIRARMDQLRIDALGYGEGVMVTFAAGIVNKLGVVRDASRQLAQGVAANARIESEPPDHTSPLYGITKWGGNIVQTIADGIYGNLGMASGAAGALAGALVPSLNGGAAMNLPLAAGGNTYVLHVNGVQYEVSSPQEMIEKLMELGAMTPEGRLA